MNEQQNDFSKSGKLLTLEPRSMRPFVKPKAKDFLDLSMFKFYDSLDQQGLLEKVFLPLFENKKEKNEISRLLSLESQEMATFMSKLNAEEIFLYTGLAHQMGWKMIDLCQACNGDFYNIEEYAWAQKSKANFFVDLPKWLDDKSSPFLIIGELVDKSFEILKIRQKAAAEPTADRPQKAKVYAFRPSLH